MARIMSTLRNVRGRLFGLLALGVVAWCFADFFNWLTGQTQWIENVYARQIYPAITQIFSSISGIFPFSLAEVLAVSLGIAAVVIITVTVIRCIRERSAAERILDLMIAAGSLALAMWILFCGWSILYHRDTLGNQLGLEVRESSTEELEELCIRLIDRANELRPQLQEDKDGRICFPCSVDEMLAKVPDAYAAVEDLPYLAGDGYCSPKPLMVSPWMNHTRIVGIYIPFTAEPNINTAILPTTLLANACHEAAHQRGIAREDEANYMAYRVCMASGDLYFMYSGTHLALVHSMNALQRADSEAAAKLRNRYGEALNGDLIDERDFWAQYEGPVAEKATAANDNYLRANAQSDGVQSYGRMVDLLLAEMRDK